MSELDPQLGGTQEKVLENLPTTDAGNCDSERDINDIFNDIALSEERISDEAYQEGFGEGELAGNIDGYHLGFHRGADIGTELGYYYGILSVQRKESTTFTERAIKAVDACMGLIDSYPRTNDEHVDLFAELEKIRSQYRKTCALLKISSKYPGANKLSF